LNLPWRHSKRFERLRIQVNEYSNPFYIFDFAIKAGRRSAEKNLDELWKLPFVSRLR
jgi:hypothetical protein